MAGSPCVTGYANCVANEHPEAVEINGWRTTYVLHNMPDVTHYCPNCGNVWVNTTERGPRWSASARGYWIHASGTPTISMICELADALRGRLAHVTLGLVVPGDFAERWR